LLTTIVSPIPTLRPSDNGKRTGMGSLAFKPLKAAVPGSLATSSRSAGTWALRMVAVRPAEGDHEPVLVVKPL
jgi:hypothetical protein